MPVHLHLNGSTPQIATISFDGKWHWNDLFIQLQSLQASSEINSGLYLVLDFATTMTPSNLIINFAKLLQQIPPSIESVIIVSTKNLMERIYRINEELGFVDTRRNCIFIDDSRRIAPYLKSAIDES